MARFGWLVPTLPFVMSVVLTVGSEKEGHQKNGYPFKQTERAVIDALRTEHNVKALPPTYSLNETISIPKDETVHVRVKRSPGYSYGYSSPGYRGRYSSFPMGKSSWQPSYGDYERVGGAKSYSPKLVYGGGEGDGAGYDGTHYSNRGYDVRVKTGYGGSSGYGNSGGYAGVPSPSGVGGYIAAPADDPYGIDEEALAKYIDQLTMSKSRSSKSSSSGSHGAKQGKGGRRRRQRNRDMKAKKGTGYKSRKGMRRRSKRRTRTKSQYRRSNSRASSDNYSHEQDYSASASVEHVSPKVTKIKNPSHTKPLTMEDMLPYIYPSQTAYSEPLNLRQQQQQETPAMLISNFFGALLRSAAMKQLQSPLGEQDMQQRSLIQEQLLQPQPSPYIATSFPGPAQALSDYAKSAPKHDITTELAKLGSLIKKTFQSMTSRLNSLKKAHDSKPVIQDRTSTPKPKPARRPTTPSPMENFINSRSTGMWSHFAKNHVQSFNAKKTPTMKKAKIVEKRNAATKIVAKSDNTIKLPTMFIRGPKIYTIRSRLSQSRVGHERSKSADEGLVSAAAEAAIRYLAQSPTTPVVPLSTEQSKTKQHSPG